MAVVRRPAGTVEEVRLPFLLPLALAPALALVPLTGAAEAAEPAPAAPGHAASSLATPGPAAPPAAPAAAPGTDLAGAVARTAEALTAGTTALEQGQAHLADVRAQAAATRAAAQEAAAVAAAVRERLQDMVAASYRSPRPGQLALALSDPGQLADALRATASLEHVQGRQSDLVQEANAERLRAEALVAQADGLEADAVEQERVLAAQVVALQAQAEQARVQLEAAAAQQAADAAAREAAAGRASRDAPVYVPGAVDLAATGGCGGGQLGGSPNGMLPTSALCPLVGTDGLLLRADAAAAFNRMAAAGGMPCAGNSYRSYGEQVSLYRVKPSLAAVPGTSNHGWGVAVDFACGADRFGSPGYQWLKAHGPTYGWTHPDWAEPGGSRPEPWHWEYTG